MVLKSKRGLNGDDFMQILPLFLKDKGRFILLEKILNSIKSLVI